MRGALHITASGGGFWHMAWEVLLDALLDTAKLLPFLFLTYLFMEFLEHKAGEKLKETVGKAGRVGPLVGAALGLLPQCGFSAVAAGLYSARVVTLGTLLAVFLATSDEMLPVLLGSAVPLRQVLVLLGIKLVVAVAVGFSADLLFRKKQEPPHVTDLCEEEHCHCEKGIFRSALHHTLHIISFVFVINLALGAVLSAVGEERLATFVGGLPVVRELLGALIGLIPNCAASVALASLYAKGVIPVGVLMAGLLPGAGAGILVLLRTNRPKRQSVFILLALFVIGAAVGILLDQLADTAAWQGLMGSTLRSLRDGLQTNAPL